MAQSAQTIKQSTTTKITSVQVLTCRVKPEHAGTILLLLDCWFADPDGSMWSVE